MSSKSVLKITTTASTRGDDMLGIARLLPIALIAIGIFYFFSRIYNMGYAARDLEYQKEISNKNAEIHRLKRESAVADAKHAEQTDAAVREVIAKAGPETCRSLPHDALNRLDAIRD